MLIDLMLENYQVKEILYFDTFDRRLNKSLQRLMSGPPGSSCNNIIWFRLFFLGRQSRPTCKSAMANCFQIVEKSWAHWIMWTKLLMLSLEFSKVEKHFILQLSRGRTIIWRCPSTLFCFLANWVRGKMKGGKRALKRLLYSCPLTLSFILNDNTLI